MSYCTNLEMSANLLPEGGNSDRKRHYQNDNKGTEKIACN